MRKILIGLAVLLLLVAGLAVGWYLVGQKQLFGKKAAVQGGTAQVRLVPGANTIGVGGTFGVEVRFTPGPEPISAITVQMDYTYQGSQPPLTVTSVDANPVLLGTGEWSVPIKSVTNSGGLARVRIAAINTSLSGFSSADEVTLATLNFRGDVPGTINVTFDAVESKVTLKSTAADTLLIPTSVGIYTVTGEPPATPTPTGVGVTPTVVPSPTVGPSPTTGPTPTVGPPVPGEPNSCNGTCGTDANCQPGLTCYLGRCRNPNNPSSTTCEDKASILPTPTPSSISELPQTGGLETTLGVLGIGVVLVIMGVLAF